MAKMDHGIGQRGERMIHFWGDEKNSRSIFCEYNFTLVLFLYLEIKHETRRSGQSAAPS